MSASPLVPGRLYRVRGPGFTADVKAENAAAAICVGIEIIIVLMGER
jgi:hypothetical protein